ncbi:MAG: hypothetical protein ACOVNU_11195 [Candidatus Kapaibacteriota bacterium]|jgi:hypothetical protein
MRVIVKSLCDKNQNNVYKFTKSGSVNLAINSIFKEIHWTFI